MRLQARIVSLCCSRSGPSYIPHMSDAMVLCVGCSKHGPRFGTTASHRFPMCGRQRSMSLLGSDRRMRGKPTLHVGSLPRILPRLCWRRRFPAHEALQTAGAEHEAEAAIVLCVCPESRSKTAIRDVQLIEVSYSPRALLVEEFLSKEECEALKRMASPRLQDAKTINRSTGAALPDKVRTNSQMYFDQASHYQDPMVVAIQERMQVLARIPPGHGEPLQVGRYRVGEFYQPHYDSEPAQNVRRAATVLVYLEPPEAGGETIFPKHRRCQEADFEDCCSRIEELVVKEGGGFAVKAEAGTAVLFFSHDLDGQSKPKWVSTGQNGYKVLGDAEPRPQEEGDGPPEL
ncbi:P4H1 [Symbiodinium necroappetens]|uniref:P4H1 protein n=1 Tax=Symbiodinium necroappetens TaxID=1628268 RepID=A0A812YZ11_9DINO|nr:P4H1 [Symbiodinium necroappetens]